MLIYMFTSQTIPSLTVGHLHAASVAPHRGGTKKQSELFLPFNTPPGRVPMVTLERHPNPRVEQGLMVKECVYQGSCSRGRVEICTRPTIPRPRPAAVMQI